MGIDLIGPLQPSEPGNTYIVTCIDYMTKNVEARALPNKQPAGIAQFFHEDIVCRHGTPVEVNMDHGGEFEGVFLDMLEQYHIDRFSLIQPLPSPSQRLSGALQPDFGKSTQENGGPTPGALGSAHSHHSDGLQS